MEAKALGGVELRLIVLVEVLQEMLVDGVEVNDEEVAHVVPWLVGAGVEPISLVRAARSRSWCGGSVTMSRDESGGA